MVAVDPGDFAVNRGGCDEAQANVVGDALYLTGRDKLPVDAGTDGPAAVVADRDAPDVREQVVGVPAIPLKLGFKPENQFRERVGHGPFVIAMRGDTDQEIVVADSNSGQGGRADDVDGDRRPRGHFETRGREFAVAHRGVRITQVETAARHSDGQVDRAARTDFDKVEIAAVRSCMMFGRAGG